jgi:hypothetical protein
MERPCKARRTVARAAPPTSPISVISARTRDSIDAW